MRCTWPEIQTIEDRGRRKGVSQKDKKNCDLPSLWNQNTDFVGFVGQLSVLARGPPSISSWGAPQTKQRRSKWCGVELQASLATQRHATDMKNSNFLPGPNNESWLFLSTNFFTCHVPSYNKIRWGDGPHFEFEQGRSRRSIVWSIPAIVAAACRCLSLERRQNRAMWGWILVVNVKERFWK